MAAGSTILGGLLGLFFVFKGPASYVADAVLMLQRIDPHTLLALFMPLLVVPSGLGMKWNLVTRVFEKSLVLAVLGTLINGSLIALVAKYVLPYGWDWVECLLFGSILAATDPVAGEDRQGEESGGMWECDR
jgi:NhaP-type Na+/H+ or K+/H+ antiporter